MKEVSKWSRRHKLNRIATIVILITLALSITIIAVTIYGSNVGNFLISIQRDTKRQLSIADNKDFNKPTSLLTAFGLNDMNDATLSYIPSNIGDLDGSNNDLVNRRYFAYTFYLKNSSAIAVDYDMEIVFNQVTQNADAALRVMLITNNERQIYAKAEGDSATVPTYDHTGKLQYNSKIFSSAVVVCNELIRNFASDAVTKYTIVMWLEGNDEDCTDEIKGGIMRLEMKFSAR